MSEKTSKSNLTPRQRRAVRALAAGDGLTEAAQAAGVTERTLYRWRQQPVFIDALRQADDEMLSHLARALNAASRDALAVLVGVVRDEKAAPGVRVRAASEILKQRAAFYELFNLADRLAELEGEIGGETGG